MARITTKEVLGFDPKQLSDDALLAALTPVAPSLPAGFGDHVEVMTFRPTCECPTCKNAADYQTAYAKYEADLARFATPALPTMVQKRVARIEAAKVKSEYEMAVERLTERGIQVIPDSECVDKGDYVIWSGWTAQDRVWTAYPSRIGGYYDTMTQVKLYSNHSMEVLMKQRKAERIFAHPTKRVCIEGWVTRPGSRVAYQYFIDRNGKQMRTEYRDTSVYDQNRIGTQTSAMGVTYKRQFTTPKAFRQARMIQILTKRYDSNKMGRQDYAKRRNAIDQLFAEAPYNNRTVTFRGQLMYSHQVNDLKSLFAQAAALVAKASDDNADAFLTLLGAFDENFSNEGARVLGHWNARTDGSVISRGDCGHYHTEDGGHAVADGTVCDACFDTHYVLTEDTNVYVHRANAYHYEYDEDETDDDGDEMVSGWYARRQGSDDDYTANGLVRNYTDNVLSYFKKDTSFTPSIYGDVLMGVELEVATKSGRKTAAAKHTHKNLCDGYAIMKNDGSLPNGGFEIVTAPRSLKEHIERFGKWEPHSDMRAWDSKVCGLHVHLSSSSFSAATLGKFLEFINKQANTSIIQAVAGRTPENDDNARQYCRREGAMVIGNPKQTLCGKSTARYHMVNTCNLSNDEGVRLGLTSHEPNRRSIDTIELRIFRASLKKGRLLAQIEFAHAAVMFCRQASFRELEREHFVAWLRKAAGVYPNLAKWFGVRSNTMTVIAEPTVCTDAEV